MNSLVCATCNPYAGSDADPLTVIAALAGRKNFVFSDRFGFLNMFSGWNFDRAAKPLPLPRLRGTRKEFDDLLDKELSRIEKCGKDLVLLYSGGIDSSCLLCAMLMRGMRRFQVLYSDSSVQENPVLFAMLKEEHGIELRHFSSETYEEELQGALKNGLLITGTYGDKLYNADFKKEMDVPAGMAWSSFLLLNGMSADTIGKLEASIAHYGIPVQTADEMLFWLSFSVLWDFGQPMYAILAMPGCNNYAAPFGSAGFQQWAMARMPGIQDVFGKDTASYKPEMKAVIGQYTHDYDYLNRKGKQHSWRTMLGNAGTGGFIRDSLSVRQIVRPGVPRDRCERIMGKALQNYRITSKQE